MFTKHAIAQGQKRGILPITDELLDRYGQEQYDGHGAIVVFMTMASRRAMERDWGRRVVDKLWDFLRNSYKVITTDGRTITVGHRYQKIHRI